MIFILSKYYNLKNGAARSALDIAKAAISSNNNINLIYGHTFDYWNLFKWVYNKNVSINRSPRFGGKNTNIIEKIETNLFDSNREKNLKKLKPNLLLVNSLGADFWGNYLKKSLKCKTILIVRESPSFYKNKDLAIKRIRRFENHLFVSDNGRKDWLEIADLKPENCFHVPNCIDINEVNPIYKMDKSNFRNSLGFSQNDFIIICIGRFMDRKNQKFLVHELPKIKKKIPNIKLVFVGKGGNNYNRKIDNFIRQKMLENEVIYMGRKKNALEYIYASDCLVLPSKAEASPRVIYEAMSLGIPCIASSVDGVSELVRHEQTGLLFNLDNPESFRNGIYKIAKNKDFRIDLAESSRKIYLENYTFDVYKSKMNMIFNKFLN